MNRKGYGRKAGSERSGEQQSRPDVQEPDEGSIGRTSGPTTTKSISIKFRCCRSGGRAAKGIELTSRDLRCAVGQCENALRARLTDLQESLTASEKSAEGVVVRCGDKAGGGHVPNPGTRGPRPERLGAASTPEEP